MMDALIIGRYKTTGVIHVASVRDGFNDQSSRLSTWCGGDLPLRKNVQAVTLEEAEGRVTCRNCMSALRQGMLPLEV